MNNERAGSELDIHDQIYIAINDYCNERGKVKKLADRSGVNRRLISKILGDEYPAGFENMIAVLDAAGYKLEVTPIGSNDRKDG